MEVFLSICNKLTVNIFEIYVILQLFDVVFKKKKKEKSIRYPIYVTKITMTFLVDYCMPYVWINFVVSLCVVFLISCCYYSRLWKRMIVALGVNLLLAVSEIVVALLINSEILRFSSRAANQESLALFLSRMMFWLFVVILKKYASDYKVIKLPMKIWFFGGLVIISTLGELIMVCSAEYTNILLESVFLLGAEVSIYLLVYLYDSLAATFTEKMKSELIQREKEYYHKEVVMLHDNQERINQFRHDWKNRIQVMEQLMEQKKWGELKGYLNEVEKKLTTTQLYSNTGNITIDSIINHKLSQAVERKIEVTTKILLPCHLKVNNDDMVVILGNLLDNAIEANEYVKKNRKIDFHLEYDNGCLFLHIKNTFDKKLEKLGGVLLSRKEDKVMHGIGLRSVNDTIERYHGTVEVSTSDNLFSTDVIMYL